jgi:hypothetical protein
LEDEGTVKNAFPHCMQKLFTLHANQIVEQKLFTLHANQIVEQLVEEKER